MAIDLKYGKIEIPGIPDDEPVFIVRGKDKLSEPLLHSYSQMCVDAGSPLAHVQAVNEAAILIGRWPTKKIPD